MLPKDNSVYENYFFHFGQQLDLLLINKSTIMKLKLIVLLIVISTSQLFSQKQPVYSIVKQPQSTEWYQNQLKLWNAEIKINPKNAYAWQNAYIAMRMIKIKSTFKTQKDLNVFIKKMQQAIPDTYEYHYLTYYNREVGGDKYEKLFHHIEKAYEIDPTRTEIYPDLLTHALMNSNSVKVKEYSSLWFNSNTTSPNILNFGYNMLASCEDNSVLITNGDNDTYPPIIVQNHLGYKPNVKVLNIYLLQKDKYRNEVFKSLGIKPFDKKNADFKTSYDFMKAIARHLEKYLKIPLYYSSTVNKGLYKASFDKTYVVGLAVQYCEKKFDNLAILKKNVELHFKIDYIETSFLNDISKQVIAQSNNAYLLGFITLYNHYKLSGDEVNKKKMDKLIRKIAASNNNSSNILKYLD